MLASICRQSIYSAQVQKGFLKKDSLEKEILACTSLEEIKPLILNANKNIPPNFKESLLFSLEESKTKLRNQKSILTANESIFVFQISLISIAKEEHSVTDLIDLAVKIKTIFENEIFFKLFNPEYFLLNENNIQNFTSACISFLSLKGDKTTADKIILKLPELKLFKEFDGIINAYLESCRKNTRNIEDVILDFKAINSDMLSTFFDSLKAQYLQVLKYEEDIKLVSDFNLKQTCDSIRGRCENKTLRLQDKLYLLAAASLKIQKEFGIYPHSTQILTVLALTSFPAPLECMEEEKDEQESSLGKITSSKGCIAQVKTGEGKSIINTILALCLAMEGKCVDIITSAKSLSMRDQEKFKNFFKIFGVKTSHICDDDLTTNHFFGQIIYGTNTDFEFSLLREQTGSQKIRVHFANPKVTRPCEVVLVDEVDNLFIDKSSNSAIISIPVVNKQRPLFVYIFNMIRQFEQESDLPDLDDLCDITRNLGSHDELLAKILSTVSDIKLRIFIENAIKALWGLSNDKQYTIQKKDTKIHGKKVLKQEVVIIDPPTGSLDAGSRWPDGLHEFLELKHGIHLQEESVTFASLCHPVFFDKYKQIYGLTGTIGTQAECKEIKLVYHVDTIQVPTYNPSKRVTLEPIICENEEGFQKFFLNDILAMQKAGRPILVLCQSIEEVYSIENILFEKKITAHSLHGKQLLSERFILSHAGTACTITVATNTASRGTDIILTKESEKNGGLHVILTYFPDSERVEDQAIGRAARQGQPGSSRMIIQHNDPSLSIFNDTSLQEIFANIMLSVSVNSYKDILLKRERKINFLSHKRTFHSNIEKLNHKFSELFFTSFAILNGSLTDEFFENLIKKDDGKYTITNLLKVKQGLIKQIKTKWGKFFSNLSHVLQEIIQEPGRSYSNYSQIEEAYTEKVENLFTEFKNKHILFFTNPIEYFLSSVDPVQNDFSENS